MKKRKNFILVLTSIMCVMLISSCDVDIPIKEMSAARNGIAEAKKYDAEKYAPDELKNAEDLLIQSHKNLIDGKSDEARKSANDAILAAGNAKNRSLPQYADSKIKQSDEMYDLADKAYAEKFSPDKFAQGKNFNSEAKTEYSQGDYVKAAELAVSSSDSFTAAINDSMQNSSSISSEISSAEKRLADLKRDKDSGAAANNLTRAESSIKNARGAFDKKDFKTSWREVDSAKKELDNASLAINKQRVSSSIANVRADIKSIQVDGLPQNITADLDSASTELNGAELSLGQNNIRDAESRVSRAESLVNGAKIKIKVNEAAAALNKVESKLAEARSKDSDKKYNDNLNKAEGLIKSGKALAASGKFVDATNNADEAENIINAALNSMEIDRQNMIVSAAAEEEEDGEFAADDKDSEIDRAIADSSSKEDVIEDSELSVPNDPNYKAAQGKTYIVQWKKKDTDCLWKISKKVYNDSSYWPAIYVANKNQIKNPDLIFPGQKLVIPPKPGKKPSYRKK
ncbi:MAG: LysM peptidoglycan-binding domain-containing protein [Leptospirales bacterium]|nr:LysM peptidoglycan-binding domain-containing protein [Leptospirales bacterium]